MEASSSSSPTRTERVLYLDTSALIKLLLAEDGSEVAREIWSTRGRRLTSSLTYPEARAALAAARRAGRTTRPETVRAVSRLEALVSSVDRIHPSERLIRIAGELADRHALRGYDAVHLASALSAGEVLMVSWDRRLRQAASACGLRSASGRID